MALKPARVESVARSFPENAWAFAALENGAARPRSGSRALIARRKKIILL
jgi:hypothetical protein